jgi:hypothetical protein
MSSTGDDEMSKTLFLASATVLLGLGTGCHQARTTLWPKVASDTVTLQADSQLSAACPSNIAGQFTFDRSVVKAGGPVTPFTLPTGKVLVVTSFDWYALGSPQVANRSRTGWLFRAQGGVNGHSAQATALADSTGKAGATEVFPSGLVVQNPGKLCIQMDPTVNGEVVIGVVNGYLAADR